MPRTGLRSSTKPSARVIENSPSAPLGSSSAPLPSPLLALPLEVRLNIYWHALQGRIVLFDLAQGRGKRQLDYYQIHYYDDLYDAYAEVFKWSAGLCNLSGDPGHDMDEDGGVQWQAGQWNSRVKACHCQSASTWQLLSVCRQTYFEALPVFYQLTKFSFSTPRHFWNFYVRIDKHAPLLEDCAETQGWYNTSMVTEESPKSRRARSKSPKPAWNDDGSFIPLKESRGSDLTLGLYWPPCESFPEPKYLTFRNPELHISSLSMIRSMQVLFDSNLRQADVVFNAVIKEMHNLQEFCVGFRSLPDFFERSWAPRHWWVERICQVRGLRKFDLRFEDESFLPSLWTLHYGEYGLGRRIRACIRVLGQICQSSASDQDATCQNWYINRLNGVGLYEVVNEMIHRILTDSDEVSEFDDSEVDESDDDGQSDMEEA
jgi:hypothetical protein